MNGGTTPTGAINRTINEKAQDVVSVKDFGAKGDVTTDDTVSIQNAINTGKSIYFPDGTYGITAQLNLTVSNIQLYGNGTIKFLSSFSKTSGNLYAFYVTGNNILFEGLSFDGAAVTLATTNNAFIWNQGAQINVSKCTFTSLPYGGSNVNCAFACTVDSTTPNCRAEFNYFNNCPGAIFFKGNSCVAIGNVILNPHDVSIALNGSNCSKCIVIGNVINNSSLNSCAGHIGVEEGAYDWVIQGNTIFGLKDGYGIGANSYSYLSASQGGIIEGNVINGGSSVTTNPCAFIACGAYYANVVISNNRCYNYPSGSSSPAIVISATGGKFYNNLIDETNGLTAVLINPSLCAIYGLDVANNTTTASQRHYTFATGDFNNIPVIFSQNKYYGGSDGINATVSSPTNLKVYLLSIADKTCTNLVVLGGLYGIRQNFFNTNNAWKFPFNISSSTVMYGDQVPNSGTFGIGDTIYNIAPAAGSPAGWMCTVAGTPGTWKAMANLV